MLRFDSWFPGIKVYKYDAMQKYDSVFYQNITLKPHTKQEERSSLYPCSTHFTRLLGLFFQKVAKRLVSFQSFEFSAFKTGRIATTK